MHARFQIQNTLNQNFQFFLSITAQPLDIFQPIREWASDYVLSSQTEKLMAGTKFSDYLGLNHYKKAKKN